MLFTLTESTARFAPQFAQLSSIIDVSVGENGLVLSCEKGNDGLTVTKAEGKAHIVYEKDVEFFRAITVLLTKAEEDAFTLHEKAHFAINGEMIDNSRNSVLNKKTAKEIIMYSALFGLDCILLYNEETFEVPEDPYFGYMRMGYTKADVRELNDFAKPFGVAIVPCIQTLAHMNQTLRWLSHWEINDVADILLVGEEKTYILIENIIKAWRECVDTDFINIGMDEAALLGRGKYLDQHGYRPAFELMCEHLKRVIEICKKYNFKPMMWSDMFFSITGGHYYDSGEIDASLLELVPEDVILGYWDYGATEKETYDKQIKKHLAFKNRIAFVGGAWKWSSIAPGIDHSIDVSKKALSACRDNNIDIVMATAWGDNGAEASIMTILPVLALYAELSYTEENVDAKISAKLEALTGYTLEEFYALCKPNQSVPEKPIRPYVNPTKYLFYQDPMMGLFDWHTNDTFPQYYADCAANLAELAKRGIKLSYVFDVLAKTCSVLELKSTLGVQMKKAYDANDKATLRAIADDIIPELLARIEVFYEAFRAQWYKESRSGGFDVQDLRIGGLKQRLLNTQRTLRAYADGEIEAIAELEIERIPADCREENSEDVLSTHCNTWTLIASPNII